MEAVSTYKEIIYGNTEVSECHFRLLLPYGCGGEIERFWRQWFASEHCPNDRCSAPALFYFVPMGCLIGKSSVASIHLWTQCCDGETAIKHKESTVYRIYQDLAGRRLFPPQQQHKIIALATQPPQEQGSPITHWSIADLQMAVLKKWALPKVYLRRLSGGCWIRRLLSRIYGITGLTAMIRTSILRCRT